MKTETARPLASSPLRVSQPATEAKTPLRVVYKNEWTDHRFAVIQNQSVQNPANWDVAWFASYE